MNSLNTQQTCKISLKNSQPLRKKFRIPQGMIKFFDTHCTFPRQTYNYLLIESLRFRCFCPPQSRSRLKPSIALMFPWDTSLSQKLESLGYPTVKIAHNPTVIGFDSMPACDRTTYGRTNGLAAYRYVALSNIQLSNAINKQLCYRREAARFFVQAMSVSLNSTKRRTQSFIVSYFRRIVTFLDYCAL